MNRLFVNQLTVIDFSYLDPQRGLLGESWQVDVTLTGSLDHQGMVLDFGEVKKQVKQLIDAEFDHRLIVPANYTGSQTSEQGKRLANRFTTVSGATIEHVAPPSAYCFLPASQVTPDSLNQAIHKRLSELLPDNVEQVSLRIYPEAIDGAYYHYSHGLKHHAGNCQRIAHGHRSRIQIIEDAQRQTALEQEWAARWQDIYIGTRSDLLETISRDDGDYLHFAYTACQGQFEITLPAKNCYLIDSDSTVENLASHIAAQLAVSHPDRELTVYAYEGINKGAIGNSLDESD